MGRRRGRGRRGCRSGEDEWVTCENEICIQDVKDE